MSYTSSLQAAFGPSNAGLGTVGVTILNADGTTATARTTSGVVDLGHGFYGKVATLADGFRGWAMWDTGGGSPLYATAPIEPTTQEVADAVWDEPRSGHNTAGTFGESMQTADATVVAAGSTTTTVQLGGASWSSGQASGRTLYIGKRGYALGQSNNDTYPIKPSWSVPADGTAVQIGILAAPDKDGFNLGSAGLDEIDVESNINVRQALSPILAAASGKLQGPVPGSAGTVVIKAANSDTTRITASVDEDGNRDTVTLNLPA